MGVHVFLCRVEDGGIWGKKGERGRDMLPPRRAVIVAGLGEPLWQQRGFGDICHFSECSLGCVSGGEGLGGVPVHQERSGMRWIAKNVSEMFVSQIVVSVVAH